MMQFFLTATEIGSADPEVLYATLLDAALLPDGCQDIDYLKGKLAELDITVPDEMLTNVEEDCLKNVGNRVETYN